MPNNLPARIPVRAETEITSATASSASAVAPAETCTPIPRQSPEPQPAFRAFTELVLDRRTLAFALRFASRVASRAPLAALRGCLFTDGFLVATDLDVSLRAHIPAARELGVLVPAEQLKRCLLGTQTPAWPRVHRDLLAARRAAGVMRAMLVLFGECSGPIGARERPSPTQEAA